MSAATCRVAGAACGYTGAMTLLALGVASWILLAVLLAGLYAWLAGAPARREDRAPAGPGSSQAGASAVPAAAQRLVTPPTAAA